MKFKSLIFLFAISLMMSSCATKTFFTHDMRVQLESAGFDLSQIQFYNQKEINLHSAESNSEFGVDNAGKIRMASGKEIEEVRIPVNTPGVCINANANKMQVQFEPGDGKSLVFYKNSYGKYQIDAEQWVKRSFGKVTYDGKTFFIQPGGNQTLLMVKKSQINKITRKFRTAKGMKVN